jgi:thiol-disulfide isomerase/thioredoxin
MKNLLCIIAVTLIAGCQGDNNSTPTLEQYKGQWVFINYWAQWCSPCIKEIPELNRLDQQDDMVQVLGVNYDGATGDELAAQLTKLGVEFPQLPQDPAGALGVPRPTVLPTTLILDPHGVLHSTLVGPQTLESLREAVDLHP